MAKTVLQINEEIRATVKEKYPDAYYDPQFGGIFYFDEVAGRDQVLAYGKTCNSAWFNAAEQIYIPIQ